MNKEEFIYSLKNPATIDAIKTHQLEEVIREFPYFQAAQAIQLKGLKTTNSFKYNQSLKITAAHTIDRSVLFDFITSINFTNASNEVQILEEIEVIDLEVVEVLHQKTKDSHSDIVTEVVEKELKIETLENEASIATLEIGKPIDFNSTEPHSFNEWMQLASQKPIEREEKTEIIAEETAKTEEKINLIDKFIETNPKIQPVDKNAKNQIFTTYNSSGNESLMTETLAKVYLEQKKYENAIKAYRILSLKYPEKSGFFADRIKAIKNLQNNKS